MSKHGVLWKGNGEMHRKWAEVETLLRREPGRLVELCGLADTILRDHGTAVPYGVCRLVAEKTNLKGSSLPIPGRRDEFGDSSQAGANYTMPDCIIRPTTDSWLNSASFLLLAASESYWGCELPIGHPTRRKERQEQKTVVYGSLHRLLHFSRPM